MNFEFDNLIPSGVEQFMLASGQLAIIRSMKNKVKYLSKNKQNRFETRTSNGAVEEIFVDADGANPQEAVNELRKRLCYICGVFGITKILWRLNPCMSIGMNGIYRCECIVAFVIGDAY